MNHMTDPGRVKDPASVRQSIAIPLFKNATFEPLLEKRISQIFKETFISRGWQVKNNPEHADLVLQGQINRYQRIPLSLDLQGVAREYRIQISIEFLLQQSEGLAFETLAEESSEYLTRSNAKASRIAEDRAIRESGQKMSEKISDLLLSRFTANRGPETEQ